MADPIKLIMAARLGQLRGNGRSSATSRRQTHSGVRIEVLAEMLVPAAEYAPLGSSNRGKSTTVGLLARAALGLQIDQRRAVQAVEPAHVQRCTFDGHKCHHR
jgi:hypothetical protein